MWLAFEKPENMFGQFWNLAVIYTGRGGRRRRTGGRGGNQRGRKEGGRFTAPRKVSAGLS